MSRSYTKVECLAEEVFRRKAAGETNREIGEHFGLSKKQIEELVKRQNRKRRLIENGYVPRPKGRPRKDGKPPHQNEKKEIERLRMENRLLRDFLQSTERT